MKKIFSAAAVASLVGLSSCTHLEVHRHLEPSDSTSGYAYMLDFTQFQVTLTRTLSSCEAGEMPAVTAEATVTPALVPDGSQLYVIDPASMISAFKTSDVLIDYKDGRLVGFNASTVDKTGDVAASVISTAGKIAMLAAVPIPVSGAQQYCSDAALAKFKVIKDNKQPIKEATANVEDAEARLAVLAAQFAAEPTEDLRKQIKALTADIKPAREALDKLTKASAAAQAWLTDKVTITWPEHSGEFHRRPGNDLGPAVVAKWFNVDVIRDAISTRPEFNPALDANDKLVVAGHDGTAARLGITVEDYGLRYPRFPAGTDFLACDASEECKSAAEPLRKAIVTRQVNRITLAQISFHLVRRGSYGSETGNAGSAKAEAGLRYRVPAAGSLYVCTFDDVCQDGTTAPLVRTDSAVAQLGSVFNIPFSSPPFASGGINLKFDDQGRLLQAGLKRESSVAAGVAGTAGAAVDQASSILSAIEKAPITEANNATKLAQARKALADAEAALVKSPQTLATEELNLLKTQQELAVARAALGPDRAKDLSKQIEIAKLEADLADLQRRQAADPNAQQEVIRAQYEAQTEMLLALRASKQAELGVIEADRALENARGTGK